VKSNSGSSNQTGQILQIDVAEIFLPLLAPVRFKGAHGGRGSGKSHFFASKLVQESLRRHTRAACVREVQSSIKDSVKQLLEDKIQKYGVQSKFVITDTEIRGPYDSLFVFKGLQTNTKGSGSATSIKSLESFNRCWVEEAQSISRKSLEILTPTFREGSEEWFSWNPNKATDPVDKFFRDNAGDPDFVCIEANYRDNPWFPEELRKDMLRDRARDPDRYAHVWLGKYEKLSEARVFRNWVVREFQTPPNVRFHYGADWGFSIDPTVLIRCFIEGRTLYVDFEAYQVGCAIDRTPALFDTVPDAKKWRITADSARPETIDYMNRHGYANVVPAIKGAGSVEDGIEFLQSYDIVVHPRCVHTVDELSSYSWKVNERTDPPEILPVLEDRKNHVIDSLRYSVEDARRAPMEISSNLLDRLSGQRAAFPTARIIPAGETVLDQLRNIGPRY
jgi:phage terminase large subunit